MNRNIWLRRMMLPVPVLAGIIILSGCTSTETVTESNPDGIVETVTRITNVTAQEAYQLIGDNADNPDFITIDIRTPDEYNSGHLEGATNIDYYSDSFRDTLDALDKDKEYLVYCRSGSRSSSAVKIMEELGFRMIYHMNSGIIGWNAEGLPLVR